ncbi:helix-turn-helix domain-containing protein [Thermodesulfobacteriota bacterium]
MGKRHPNHRLVKIHRSYTVEEVSRLLGKHKNTVRRWVKDGLATIDDKRPMLILGHDLVKFIKKRRAQNKQNCTPGQLYCLRCRTPKFPLGNMAEYEYITEKFGNLIAICPDCDAIMNQRVSLVKIGLICGKLDILFPKELQHIVNRTQPTVNSDLRHRG